MTLMSLFILLFASKIKPPKFRVRHYDISLYKISTALTVVLFILLVYYNGYPNLDAFDIEKVYEVRAVFNSSQLIERIQSVYTFIIVPILIANLIKERLFLHLFLLIVFILFIYLTSGGKTIIAVALLSTFSYIFLARGVFISSIAVLLISLCGFLLFFESTYEHYLVFRPLIIPAWLSFVYYDFFSAHDLLIFSEVFPALITPSYDMSSAEVVGEYLFHDKGGSWANSGYIGSSYANLGFIGIVIDTIILSLVLMAFNALYSLTKYKQELLIVTFIFGVLSAHIGLYTLLWSRGFIFIVLLFWVIQKNSQSQGVLK
jgi:hypothetical protein